MGRVHCRRSRRPCLVEKGRSFKESGQHERCGRSLAIVKWSLVARFHGPLRRPPTHACVALDQTSTPAPVSPPVRSRQRSEALPPKMIAWRPATAKAIATTPAKKKSGARRMLM